MNLARLQNENKLSKHVTSPQEINNLLNRLCCSGSKNLNQSIYEVRVHYGS